MKPDAARVVYDRDYDEFSVRYYANNQDLGEGPRSYHGNDWQDAIDTACHEVGAANVQLRNCPKAAHTHLATKHGG